MYIVPIDDSVELVLLPVTAAEEVSTLVQRNRERLAPWMNWVAEPFTAERARDWLRECIDEFVTGRRIGTYLRVDGELAGWAALDIRGHVGVVGYWLDAAYEGRGLASRAITALLNVGFGQRELERIELRTVPANARSQRVASRLGFQHEGTLRHAVARPQADGQVFEDELLFALLAGEWVAARSAAVEGQ